MDATIARAIRRARIHLEQHPEDAISPDRPATATIESGLRSTVPTPDGSVLITDMSRSVGGGESGPSPGWLLRAAYAACDATLIAMRAAEEGITLTKLEVTVDSESDSRGLVGAGDAPAGPLRYRVKVAIAAEGATDERLREVVEWAREHSPVDDAIRRAVPVDVEIVVPASTG